MKKILKIKKKRASARDNKDNREIAAVESFRVGVQFAIQRIMMEQGISQNDLAVKMGISQSRISQFLSPSCNIIRNLARIFHALGDRCIIWSPTLARLAAEGKVPNSLVNCSRLRK